MFRIGIYVKAMSRFPLFRFVSLGTSKVRTFCRLLNDQKFLCCHTEYALEGRLQIHRPCWRPMNRNRVYTPGFDVVKLPKVEPVGGMLGGYLDL